MLKILIADDELLARSRLRDLLADIGEHCIIAEASHGKEALELCEMLKPDVILLDITMPEMNGLETAQHLQHLETPPAIIFTTAHDHYAVQAFDMNAIDYLLKPIRQERLRTALSKAGRLHPQQLTALSKLAPRRTHLHVTERGRVLLIPVTDIIYLRAELKYITVRTAEGEYLIEDSLTHLEQEFGDTFIRLHRNCLVAKAYINGFEKRGSAENAEKQWVALLKYVTETITISRRQQHVIRMHQL